MIVLTRKQKIAVAVFALAIVSGAIVYIRKKKKSKAISDGETSNDSVTINSAVVYTGINSSQTLILQQKINSLITTGKLAGLGEIYGFKQLPLGDMSDVTKSIVDAGVNNALFSTFKSTISKLADTSNGLLREDGIYGKNTLKAVKALQTYLNKAKGSKLTVDGKYGTKTDAATGWGICQ